MMILQLRLTADRMEKQNVKDKMLLQIHDELVFEVPQGEAEELKSLVSELTAKACTFVSPRK